MLEAPMRDLRAHDGREHLRAQYLFQRDVHDIAVQHDKIRREPGRESPARILRECRVRRVARHAPQSLRPRQRLRGVPGNYYQWCSI